MSNQEDMPEGINAGSVFVNFQGEGGTITKVSVASLLNELFAVVFKLEERIAALEGKEESSSIITLDKL